VRGILSLFRVPTCAEEITDPARIKQEYSYWRLRIFYSMFIGYAFYYFTRKSFTFAMPGMIQDLGLDKSQLGILSTIMAVTYGLSKFLSGIIADRSNARYLMSTGLIVTGVCNIFFGFSSTLASFALFWGLNGWFQGFGAPPVMRLLTHWYARKERGRWWACWNVSHNVGSFLIPLLAGLCTLYLGWRYALYIPGVVCIGVGFFLINRLRDTPQSLGLPLVEVYRQDFSEIEQGKGQGVLKVKDALMNSILTNKSMWLLAAAYFFVHVVRIGINDWTALFLQETKGYRALVANSYVSLFEAGGFAGCLIAGWVSDRLFSGQRNPVNVLYSIGLIAAFSVFWLVSSRQEFADSYAWVETASMFLIGFCIFGPQMMIGMAASEMVPKGAAATANGFVGLFAYLGAAAAGYPLGKIAQEWGWEGFLLVMALCCAATLLFLIPLVIPAKKSATLPMVTGKTA